MLVEAGLAARCTRIHLETPPGRAVPGSRGTWRYDMISREIELGLSARPKRGARRTFSFEGPTMKQLSILQSLLLRVDCVGSLARSDEAIAELQQLLADQRAVLDRQARIIEEQGRTLKH